MALNFDINDPRTQKTLAILMVPILLLALFYNFMIKPKTKEIDKKTAEVKAVNQQLQRLKSTLKSPEILEKEREKSDN